MLCISYWIWYVYGLILLWTTVGNLFVLIFIKTEPNVNCITEFYGCTCLFMELRLWRFDFFIGLSIQICSIDIHFALAAVPSWAYASHPEPDRLWGALHQRYAVRHSAILQAAQTPRHDLTWTSGRFPKCWEGNDHFPPINIIYMIKISWNISFKKANKNPDKWNLLVSFQ